MTTASCASHGAGKITPLRSSVRNRTFGAREPLGTPRLPCVRTNPDTRGNTRGRTHVEEVSDRVGSRAAAGGVPTAGGQPAAFRAAGTGLHRVLRHRSICVVARGNRDGFPGRRCLQARRHRRGRARPRRHCGRDGIQPAALPAARGGREGRAAAQWRAGVGDPERRRGRAEPAGRRPPIRPPSGATAASSSPSRGRRS